MTARLPQLLDEAMLCVRTMDVFRFLKLRERIEREWDPLLSVFSTSEAAEVLELPEREVRRKCESGELEGRKSGGVWLVRL